MIDSTLKEAYGSYVIPEVIKGLIRLEEGLVKDGLTLAIIGVRPVLDYSPYSITPLDLIPFADTGGDGIHFGFLTEFGQIKSLEEAPVVCVSPTNDPPIRLIARNIREFLDLASSVPYVEDLERWWSCRNETAMLAEGQQWEDEAPVEMRAKRQEVYRRFRNAFSTRQQNVHSYIKEVLQERESRIALATLDGLGVINPTSENVTWQRYESAHWVEKLAFLRDIHYRCMSDLEYNDTLRGLLIDLLESMALKDEMKRMLEI
ncbi:MAG: hypothetical protein K0S39_5928 [Paenibacillus sp.]|nr:hypothetical protein [Paenibacillus sp.]